MLQALADNLGSQGIGVILVSVDEPEDNEKARAFLNSLELRLPSYIAARPLGAFKEGLYPRWPGMVPATFLFDGRGVARYFWGGPVRDEEILPVVEGFLAGKTIDGESDFTLAPGTVEH
jgi:peroxiredoxin